MMAMIIFSTDGCHREQNTGIRQHPNPAPPSLSFMTNSLQHLNLTIIIALYFFIILGRCGSS